MIPSRANRLDGVPSDAITAVWFDLDATLYPPSTGLWRRIGERIEEYLLEVLGFPPDQARTVQLDYYKRYGTTLRGLQQNGQVDTGHYLDFVHDVPVEDWLSPDPALREMLSRLKVRPWIFTNSDRAHAARVLEALAIADCFEGWITVESIDFECKPNREAYAAALAISGQTEPGTVLFLDDSDRNLAGGRAFGLRTILVSEDPVPGTAAEWQIRRPLDLMGLMPGLFNGT